MNIFKKVYDSNNLPDLAREIDEAFGFEFNPNLANIPRDEFGMLDGSFVVTIEWKEEQQ